MIRVIELYSGLFKGNIQEQMEAVIQEKGITREKLIDIKYTHDNGASFVLIIYEE